MLSMGMAAGENTLNVTVQPFADLMVAITSSAPADVLPLARTSIAGRLAAPVGSLEVEVGDEVERGDVLVRLECDDFEDRMKQVNAYLGELEARRRLADARLKRTFRLHQQGAVSVDEYDATEAELDVLTASVRSQRSIIDSARRDVERCEVTAPFAAIIDARMIDEGEFIQPGTPLLNLLDRERLEVRAYLTDRDAATLASAGTIFFRNRNADYALKLRRIVPVEDAATRMREARLVFTDQKPVPGSAGRIHWQVTDRALSADMLVRRGGELGVMIVDGEYARFRAVPGAVEGRPAMADNIPGDTMLVVGGRFAAADGDRIRIIEPEE